MRSSRQGAIPSELGDLIDELDDIQRRLRILEAPSGESLNSTVAKLAALVADIQAELDAYLAGRYTNTDIDNKDAAVQAQISPAVSSGIASAFGGSPTVGGNLTVNGEMRVPNAYNTDITWTRRTGWWGNDGRAGYASSSRTKKTSIRPANAAELVRLLDVEPKSFIYRPEIARRTRLRINEGIDYVPARELGLLAEELDDAGLGFFVYHNEETGAPEGIEYGMLTVALLAIAREQRGELDEIRRRLDSLEGDR